MARWAIDANQAKRRQACLELIHVNRGKTVRPTVDLASLCGSQCEIANGSSSALTHSAFWTVWGEGSAWVPRHPWFLG